MATILLADGVSMKAVVVDGSGSSLAVPPPVGAAVRGVPVPVGVEEASGGDQLVDLRFVVADEGGAR